MNLEEVVEKQYSQAEDAPRPIDKRLINFLRDIDSGMNAQEACKKYGFKIENKTCLNCGNHHKMKLTQWMEERGFELWSSNGPEGIIFYYHYTYWGYLDPSIKCVVDPKTHFFKLTYRGGGALIIPLSDCDSIPIDSGMLYNGKYAFDAIFEDFYKVVKKHLPNRFMRFFYKIEDKIGNELFPGW